MRCGKMLLVLFVVACGPGRPADAQQRGPATGDGWQSDFAKAEAEAQRRGLPLVVHFSAEWCLPCRRMERDVLRSAEVARQLGTTFIGVKLDADAHPDLAKRFEVHSLPSDLILGPDGRVLARTTGYQDRRTYLGRIARIDEQISRPHRLVNTQPAVAPKPPGAPVVGLDGYSPVSLWNWREWRKGRPEFAVAHQGLTYFLSSADEVSQFKANPERYSPKLLGCDPVVLWESDRAVAGSTKHGAYYDGELYLFRDAQTRRRFKDNPLEFIKTRHVLRVDDIQKTELR